MMAGGNLLTLKEILGHHSITTTMKYAHLAPDYLKSDAARVTFEPRNAGVVNLSDRRGRTCPDEPLGGEDRAARLP